MQFVVMAYDATDEGAPARRMAAREAHLATIARFKAAGNMKMGAALLNDAGAMIGSCIVCDFESREAMDAWLAEDPYMVQKVWGEVTITPCRIAPSFTS